MIDRRPALIARCTGAADVIACVEFARQHGLLLAVRGGGHSFPGHSVCDDGLMVDLSLMKSIRIQPEARTAWVEPGVLWGEFDRECHAFGLAVTGGQISHTGVAGLTLGGGVGWLARRFGLTVDSLRSVDIVTADGRLQRASEQENPDIFWAIRGGGGNFGIVTRFEFRLHPVSMVLGGLVAHPLARAAEGMRFMRDFARGTPNELSLTGALLHTPDGHPAFGIALCYSGPPEEGQRLIQPLREFGPPVMTQIGLMPYPALQSMLDDAAVPGRRYYIRSHFLNDLTDDVIEVLTHAYENVPSPLSSIVMPNLGGELQDYPRASTAFYHRNAGYLVSAFSCWEDPAEDEANVTWIRALGDALAAHVGEAVYVNELVDEGEERIRAAYGEATYRRLAEIKARVDPTNLFRLNQNIPPATV